MNSALNSTPHIQALEVRNFTILPDGTYHFAPGINFVIGENNVGKTHLLKLLYALLKVQEPPTSSIDNPKGPTREAYSRRIAEELVAVFRPDQLGRLVRRRQGRQDCFVSVQIAGIEGKLSFTFSTHHSSEVKVLEVPTAYLPDAGTAIYLSVREALSLVPWFVSLYEQREVPFEKPLRDLVIALMTPPLRGPREQRAKALLKHIEPHLGGRVETDPPTGRLYLKLTNQGKMEIPLVAEGLRKIATLIRLIQNGTLLERGFLFWDEPEANLNPRFITPLTKSLIQIARQGTQMFIATHSLFFLREMEMHLAERSKSPLSVRWFGLYRGEKEVRLEQADRITELTTPAVLAEELRQSEAFLRLMHRLELPYRVEEESTASKS